MSQTINEHSSFRSKVSMSETDNESANESDYNPQMGFNPNFRSDEFSVGQDVTTSSNKKKRKNKKNNHNENNTNKNNTNEKNTNENNTNENNHNENNTNENNTNENNTNENNILTNEIEDGGLCGHQANVPTNYSARYSYKPSSYTNHKGPSSYTNRTSKKKWMSNKKNNKKKKYDNNEENSEERPFRAKKTITISKRKQNTPFVFNDIFDGCL